MHARECELTHMHACVHGGKIARMDGWLAGWLGGSVAGWLAGWMDGWIDGGMDGRREGGRDGHTFLCRCRELHLFVRQCFTCFSMFPGVRHASCTVLTLNSAVPPQRRADMVVAAVTTPCENICLARHDEEEGFACCSNT